MAKPPKMQGIAWAAVASSVVLALGCSRDGGIADSELGELVLAPKATDQAIDLNAATRDPRELARAIAMPHSRLATLLGPHRVRLKSSLDVSDGNGSAGKVVEQLSDETAIEFASVASWSGVMNNSSDYGREIVFADGNLYLRARYQRWHQRPPTTRGEPAALRDRFYETNEATWDVLVPGIGLFDQGPVTFAGRPARKIAITNAAQPQKPASEALVHRKWRESRTVEAVEGTATLDAATGALLQLSLQGTVGFRRDGRTFSMQVSVASAVSDLGQTPTITLPPAAEIVLTPGRFHEVDDRDTLLEGIAPPLRGGEKPGPKPAERTSPQATPAGPSK